MNLKISFKKIEHTEALDEMIRKKSKKLEKYFDGTTDVHWVCYIQDGKESADVKVKGPHFDFTAKSSAPDMYKAIDESISKIEKQIKKQKEIWKNNIHKNKKSKSEKELDGIDGYGMNYVEKMFKKK